MSGQSPSSERGAAMVEFTFSMGVFFFVLVLFLDAVVLGFRYISTQYLAARAARLAMVTDGGGAVSCNARAAAIKTKVLNLAHGATIRYITANDIFICPESALACNGNNPGGPGELVRIQIRIPVFVLTFDTGRFLEAEGIGRNEDFVRCS